MPFAFGLEHEVAFLNQAGQFADFACTKFADLAPIIEALPSYPSDYPQLRIGDAGIKQKRWYIECFERYANSAEMTDCVPKGIEIRTTIQPTIQGVLSELSQSFALLTETAGHFGFSPVGLSFNPYQSVFEPDPPLNASEIEAERRSASPEARTQRIAMLTYGPDLNVSVTGISTDQLIELGQKLTYYSPYLVPFSFSSPFYQGKLWPGLSVRTFIRTGDRPACLVFINEPARLINSVPSLTKLARLPAEIGRIEFKAFDLCYDAALYAGLLALLKGLVLDQSLLDRAITPDATRHQLSALEGFENQHIFTMAGQVLHAAATALAGDADLALLEPLYRLLEERKSPAHQLITRFKQVGCIDQVLKDLTQAWQLL